MRVERQTGVIKTFGRRGFGFLTADDGRDLFVHISDIDWDDEPRVGDRVSFIEEGVGRGGHPRARQVMRE